MTVLLTAFQKDLLDALQRGIEICPRPYEKLAVKFNCREQDVLEGIGRLKKEGFIRRFRGLINARALGRAATLATAQVPQAKLDKVAAAVSALPGVSHNYLRDHAFNLWFTLQAESLEQIEKTLSELARQHGIEFYSLPSERVFKLDVRFVFSCSPEKTPDLPGCEEAVELSDVDRQVLSFLQQDFPLTGKPFSAVEGLDEASCVDTVRSLAQRGVLKRIAAVVNHYKLGYQANVMFCVQIDTEQIESVGTILAGYKQVSHCYQRKTFAGWPYNVFAMIHAHSDELLKTWIEDFVRTLGIRDYALLRTVRELKKEPVILDFF